MTAFLVATIFATPLLFFTDLTRNPYFTQIALLNIAVAGLAAAWVVEGARAGRWVRVRTPLDVPWALMFAAALASWAYAYAAHQAFFRESMRSEGLRAAMFLAVNSFCVYWLAAARADGEPGEPSVPLGGWAAFCLAWGGAWSLFPQLRAAPSGLLTLWPHMWDPFGFLLWVLGLSAVVWLARKGDTHDLWHVFLAAAFLGSVYAVFQYFGVEFFWPKILNPYGGRSVSTFGNPNFMSSYMVMAMPLAVTYYLHARSRAVRFAYGAVFLALEASLLCSLTRSSWVGAVAAVAPLAFSAKLRRLARQDPEALGLVAALALVMGALWPQSAVEGYAPSVFGRLSEMKEVLKSAGGGQAYSPLHQRMLIWLCAWTMGAENPLFGKGFGLLELFYPFYQGHFMQSLEFLRSLRTHANNAHNEVLELFSQTGIIGLGAGLLMWTAFFRRVWSAIRIRTAEAKGGKDASDSDPVWALAAASGAAGMLVDNLLNVSMHFAVPGFLFWWQAGTAMGCLSRREGLVVEVPAPRAKAWTAAAAAVLGALFVASHWTGQWMREALYFQGFKLMRRSDARGAAEVLERAHRWHAREVNTNYELANAYARSDDFEKAVWAYKEALNANAGYDEIYFNLGTLESLKLHRRSEALDHFRVSWAINPLSGATTANLAALLLQGSDPSEHAEAERVLAWGLELEPENANYAMTLAGVLSQEGKHSEAARRYEALLRRLPNLRAAEQGLSAVVAQGKLPPSPVSRQAEEFRRLEERLGARDYGPASLKMAREAAKAFPESVVAWFYLGNLELIHGDGAAAERLLRRVVERDPGNLGAKVNLGQALKLLGRGAEAAAVYRQVLAADPGNQAARAALSSSGAP
ncbi:MAG: O-antigen ligase family protein [Elusimicrobia bacterium]|nr:O-antigen ligase family protein [Elusimicrobiota bacterium]